jgi:hypothetical protein
MLLVMRWALPLVMQSVRQKARRLG